MWGLLGLDGKGWSGRKGFGGWYCLAMGGWDVERGAYVLPEAHIGKSRGWVVL